MGSEMCIRDSPGSMEAGEYGLTRGTCFVARRLEAVAVAGFLWISWCVLGAAGFRVIFLFLFFERTRPAGSMRPPCPINLSTSSCTINFQPSGRAFFYRGSPHLFLLSAGKAEKMTLVGFEPCTSTHFIRLYRTNHGAECHQLVFPLFSGERENDMWKEPRKNCTRQ